MCESLQDAIERDSMNGFDLMVLVIVLFCMIRGVFRGLIREVSGIVAVIAGFYGAFMYYWILSPHLAFLIQTPAIRDLVSFGVLFCSIVILVGLLAALIRKLMHVVFLGWVDRTFGLIFGTAKGVLIVSVLFIILTTFVPSGSADLLKRSETAPYLANISRAMTLFISHNVRMDFLDRLKKSKVKNAQTNKEGRFGGITGPCSGGDPDIAGRKRV